MEYQVSKKKGRLTIIFNKTIPRFMRTHQVPSSILLRTEVRKDAFGQEKEVEVRKVVGINLKEFFADKRFESFNNIKTIEAAKAIIGRRQGTLGIEKAYYNGEALEL